jgi:hypothetical protein
MAGDFGNLGMEKLMPADFIKLGKERTDAMMTLQKDLLDAYEQASNAWLARVKSEADLWSGLAAKLTMQARLQRRQLLITKALRSACGWRLRMERN